MYFLQFTGLRLLDCFFRHLHRLSREIIAAVNDLAILLSVLGILGYFGPKYYVVLFRPELNATEHFQAPIQNYTKKQSAHD